MAPSSSRPKSNKYRDRRRRSSSSSNEGAPILQQPDDIELTSSRRATSQVRKEPEVESEDSDSDSDSEDDVHYTREDVKNVVKKFDRYLVSFLALLYMLSFLDRSNIGNAKIAGMVEDLDISPVKWDWLLTAFYITYILFEWMTLLWHLIPAHTYIALCVFSWGLLASLQGLSPSYTVLLLLRVLLGISEAAFGPGVPFYLSFFYRREELAFRTGLFISAAPLSTAYAGSLAYLLTSFKTQLAPWRLLFIIEGWPSLVAAVVAWWWIPDSPEDAWFLKTQDEKRVATLRLLTAEERERRRDRFDYPDTPGLPLEKSRGGLQWREILMAVGDFKNWITAFMFFSCNVAFSSLPVFLPTIINEMGTTRLQAQALSAPPYLVAFLVVISTSYYSDRLKSRSSFVMLHSLIGALGYAILAFAPAVGLVDWRWRYGAVYLAASGIFSAIAIIIPWTVGNAESSEGRGTGVAILNLVGQCGPLLGTRLYPKSSGPFYVKGMMTCSFFMLVVCGLAGGLRVILGRENRRRDEAFVRRRRREVEEGHSVHGMAKGFRYML